MKRCAECGKRCRLTCDMCHRPTCHECLVSADLKARDDDGQVTSELHYRLCETDAVRLLELVVEHRVSTTAPQVA